MRRLLIGVQLLVAVTLVGAGAAPARPERAVHNGAIRTVLRAPMLKASGRSLRWSSVPRVRRYVLATVIGHRTRYRVVHGTRFLPAPRPGRTVVYRVKAHHRHARWSRAVRMRWPEVARASRDGNPLKVSVENTTGWGVDAAFRDVGVQYERLDVGDGSDLHLIAKALGDGMTPLVLYNAGHGDNGGLRGISPSDAAAQVVSLAQRLSSLAARYPIMDRLHVIEFGNEVYNQENVATYAAQYDAAHRALAAHGLSSWKLLAVATSVCGSLHAQNWIPDFIRRMSSGAAEVDAWAVHPYGSLNTDTTRDCAGPHGYGWPDVRDWHQIAVAHGSGAPWYVTEVGQCISSGYDCPRIVDPATQAEDLTRYLNDVGSRFPWVVFFNWYTSCDDGSGGYGLLAENSARVCGADGLSARRPAFDALARWIAVNGEG